MTSPSSSPSASTGAAQSGTDAAASGAPSAFAESTHLHYWLFSSRAQLQQERELYHAQYVQRLAEERQGEVAVSGSALTLSEQSALVLHYLLLLGSLCSLFAPPLPASVQCTALMYLQRFYTRHSPQAFHPKQLMLTCLLLAGKVEEHYVAPARIAEKVLKGAEQRLEEKAEEIVRLEVPLLDGIGFHLRCHHPHRAVRALLRRTAEREQWGRERRREAEERALALVHAAYLTDAVLLYSHSQLALAAVHRAVEELCSPQSAAALLESVALRTAASSASLLSTLSAVSAFLERGAAVDRAEVRRVAASIDKKLSRCRELRNDPTSAEWRERERRRAEEKERRRADKARQRAENERRRMEQFMQAEGQNDAESRTRAGDDDDDGFVIVKRNRREGAEQRAADGDRSSRRSHAERDATVREAAFGRFQ